MTQHTRSYSNQFEIQKTYGFRFKRKLFLSFRFVIFNLLENPHVIKVIKW